MLKTKNLILIALGAILGASLVGGMFYLGQQKQRSDVQVPVTPQPTTTTTPGSQAGAIEGSLSYPSEGIPDSLIVCAETPEMEMIKCTNDRIQNTKYTYGVGYTLEIKPGTYYVYATLDQTGRDRKAYYSQAVVCGLTVECEDHSPIPVTVDAGETVENIDPGDWYAN